MIMKFLGSLFSALPMALIEKVLDYYERKNTSAAEVTKKRIEAKVQHEQDLLDAEIEVRKEVARQQLVSKSRWETRWIRPAFAGLIFVWVGAIVYDNLNLHLWGSENWNVDDFPPSLEWLPITVVTTYFLARPVFEKRKR